jgi:hypothetical protein
MLLTLLLWPVGWFVRRHYGHKLQLTSIEKRLRVAVRLVFALDLLFVLAMCGMVIYGLSHLEVFTDQGTKWFYLIQGMGLLGAIGTLVVLYNAMRSWRSQEGRIWGKLQATLFVLACLGFLWFVLAGRLLHFTSIY